MILRVFYCIAPVLSLIATVQAASAGEASSRYVSFELEKCPSVEKGEEMISVTFHCKTKEGYELLVTEGDLRYYVGFGPKAKDQRAYRQTLAPFNTIHNVIELRFRPGADRPHATILRYHTDSGMGDGVKGQVLVVTKLDGDEACQVAHVDALANKDANELARQAADGASAFDCANDEPKTVGARGKSPM